MKNLCQNYDELVSLSLQFVFKNNDSTLLLEKVFIVVLVTVSTVVILGTNSTVEYWHVFHRKSDSDQIEDIASF